MVGGRQAIRLAAEFPAPPAVWERLAAEGRTTLAVDPYECHAPRAAEGVLLCGWGMRERVVLERWSRPRAPTAARAAATGGPPT